MPTIQELAKDYSRRFEGATRPDGSRFRRVKEDEKSEELTELIREAHNGLLPDDHKYAMIEAALDAIAADGEDAQLEPEVYTSGLTGWLASHNDRLGYLEEALKDLPHMRGHGDWSAFELLQNAYSREQEEVLAFVLQSLTTLVEDMEEANA